jgi:hypothetical protein
VSTNLGLHGKLGMVIEQLLERCRELGSTIKSLALGMWRPIISRKSFLSSAALPSNYIYHHSM